MTTLPLSGVKVVEFTAFNAGPTCGSVLGDWGAEIVKLEHPVRGDPARGIFSMNVVPNSDVNYVFELYNRNKKSLGVDLKTQGGKRVIHRLVKDSDVFLSNIQGQELKRMELDYETLSQLNPKLIYAHLLAYGDSGPDADRPGFDQAAIARSGMNYMLYELNMPSPPVMPRGYIDRCTGTFLAGGIALALLVREKTGLGQKVSTSLFNAALWVGGRDIEYSLLSGKDVPRISRHTVENPLFNLYQTKDDRWLVLLMTQTDPYWDELCQVLGDERLKMDPRFAHHIERVKNNTALISLLDAVFAQRSLAEWEQRFSGRNLLWDVVRTPSEVAQDPQAEACGGIVPLEHPRYANFRLVASPVKLSLTPPNIREAAPELGQHTEEVLLGLGYSWEDIAALKEEGAIT